MSLAQSQLLTEELTSVLGAKFQLVEPDQRQVQALSQSLDIPEIIARVMVNRGINLAEGDSFLAPTIKELLPNPSHLLDMDKAAEFLAQSVITGKKIAVFGDYDVDGATSSALLKRYFNEVGSDLLVYIPDRVKEGYGPNSEALLKLREQGVEVCITVDCGTLAFEPLKAAKEAGLEVIVVDHHLGAESLPEAKAVINPNRLDEQSDQRHLAAVGVTFLLVVALNTVLKNKGWFDKKLQPNLLNYLDLVALGTVCDVVPLTGINRAFVSQGLKVIRGRKNVGLSALSDVARVNDVPSAYHLGFVFGPRINAGGRVGKSDLGVRLLSTNNVDQAFEISRQLDHYNQERQAIEKQVLDQAVAQVESQVDQDLPVIFAVGQAWHQGVIGIVASRIKDLYHKPAAVISVENGVGKASARSISGVDFGAAIVAANQAGLLIAGGGHAMAAGFSVEQNKILQLLEFLSDRFASDYIQNATKIIKIDGHLSVAGASLALAQQLKQLEPFGIKNQEPRFLFSNAHIIKSDILGGKHLRLIISDGTKSIKAMVFNCIDSPLGQTLLSAPGQKIEIVAKVRLNNWQGQSSVELLIEDIMLRTP